MKQWIANAIEAFNSNVQKNQYYREEEKQKAIFKILEAYKNKNFKKINFFSFGNKKLNKNIMIFNLPAVVTCKCNCKGCYAQKAERLYKNTRIQRMINYITMLLCQYNDNFKKYITDLFVMLIQIHGLSFKNPIIRIHESGDFFNKKYLNFWLNIINKIYEKQKDICFYTYSKQLDNKTIDKINATYKNFNIVKSFIELDGKKYINFGNEEYIKMLSKKLDEHGLQYHICDYGHGNTMRCGVNCKACCKYSIVLFYIH